MKRDLKPGNVMLSVSGKIKIIDFGLCLNTENLGRDDKEKINEMVGSPYYMPPEMIKRHITSEKVDIWSFGICVSELGLSFLILLKRLN